VNEQETNTTELHDLAVGATARITADSKTYDACFADVAKRPYGEIRDHPHLHQGQKVAWLCVIADFPMLRDTKSAVVKFMRNLGEWYPEATPDEKQKALSRPFESITIDGAYVSEVAFTLRGELPYAHPFSVELVGKF
jgi:hypothetical protein